MVPCGTLILPYLYLGDESDASDPEKLKSHNIYYVLNVTADLPGDGEKGSIRYKRIPARDSFDQNLAQYFDESFQFIEEARQAERAVLIHCHAGISRSPTIVVAYLMYSQKMNFDSAFKFVVNKRPKISPNFSFVGQLYEYEKTSIRPTLSTAPTTILTPSSSTTISLPSTPITTNTSPFLPPLLPTITVSPSPSPSPSSSSSSSSSTTSTLTSSMATLTNTTTTTSNGPSKSPSLLLPIPISTPSPPPNLSLVTVKTTNSNGKTLLLSPISLVTNTLSTTTITTSISAPTTPTSPMPLPPPSMPTTPILTTMPTTPTANRSYLKISDTLNKPFFLQPPPPPLNSSSNPLKDGLIVKPDVLPSSCEALSDIPYNSLGPVRGCRSRKSCNNDFILLRPIKMTKNTRVK